MKQAWRNARRFVGRRLKIATVQPTHAGLELGPPLSWRFTYIKNVEWDGCIVAVIDQPGFVYPDSLTHPALKKGFQFGGGSAGGGVPTKLSVGSFVEQNKDFIEGWPPDLRPWAKVRKQARKKGTGEYVAFPYMRGHLVPIRQICAGDCCGKIITSPATVDYPTMSVVAYMRCEVHASTQGSSQELRRWPLVDRFPDSHSSNGSFPQTSLLNLQYHPRPQFSNHASNLGRLLQKQRGEKRSCERLAEGKECIARNRMTDTYGHTEKHAMHKPYEGLDL